MAVSTEIKLNKKISPLNDKVLVAKAVAEEKSEGGIYLPTSSQEKPVEGVIIAAGPGPMNEKNERKPLQVKEGDRILYSKYSGVEIKVEGHELLIMSEKDILAIVG